MPRTRPAASWVSPSVRRRRRRADLMHACASAVSRIGFSGDPELNSRAPMAMPERVAFDRYPDDGTPLKVAICVRFLYRYCENRKRQLTGADER